MANIRPIEIIAGVREDLHNKLRDPAQFADLPQKIKTLAKRSSGSQFTDLDGTDKWYLWRFWGEQDDKIEYDYNNPILNFLDTLFTQEWHWLKPLSVWWWDTGMMLGTLYENGEGDVRLNDPNAIPWFPYDYAKAKRFIPDLVIPDPDWDGVYPDPENPEVPVLTYDIVHDMRPYMFTPHQCYLSKGPYNLQRRTMQITSNKRLGADAFGLKPWSPTEKRVPL